MSDRSVPLSETAALMQTAQTNFLQQGGVYVSALALLRSQGLIDREYTYREYPKMLHIKKGTETIHRMIEDIKGRVREWDETVDIIDNITVHSEEEEDRVLNGGKSAAVIEEERQGLLALAKARGVRFDPSWSTLRLQRELGMDVTTDKPAAFDELTALREQVARLEEQAKLRARIAELQAEEAALAPPPTDEVEEMRTELRGLGVHVDMRWGTLRLRQELDRATAPKEA